MNPDDQPGLPSGVIDLDRYKQAAQARRAREKAGRRASRPSGAQHPGGESFLGGRPRAGLILAMLAAAFLAMTLLPRLL